MHVIFLQLLFLFFVDLSSSKFLTSPYKPISSGDHTSSSFSQTPAKYSAMSGFALQYSTLQSTGDFDKITAGVTDEQCEWPQLYMYMYVTLYMYTCKCTISN